MRFFHPWAGNTVLTDKIHYILHASKIKLHCLPIQLFTSGTHQNINVNKILTVLLSDISSFSKEEKSLSFES